MGDLSKLASELEDAALEAGQWPTDFNRTTLLQARSELLSRIRELEAEVYVVREASDNWRECAEDWRKRAEKAEAENARLREAGDDLEVFTAAIQRGDHWRGGEGDD